MKKSIRVLLGFALVFALVAVGTTGYFYLLKDKSNEPLSFESGGVIFDSGNYVASVNGVSVITDDTGVRIFNEADKTEKVIFDKPAMSPIFDGERAFFVEGNIEDYDVELYDPEGELVSEGEYGPWERAKIYSYNVKTDKVEEVILTNNHSHTMLVYLDETNIYYTDINDDNIGMCGALATSSFYKYDIVNKKRTMLLKDVAWYCVDNGKMFYQTEAIAGTGEDGYHSLYVYDFESGKFKIVSNADVDFLKYEDETVFFVERVRKYDDNYEFEDVRFTLKSFCLNNNETNIIDELDFLPDNPRIWATYTDKDTLSINGKEFDEVLYNLKDRSFMVVDEPEKFGHYEKVGSTKYFVENLYSIDNQTQEEKPSGVAVYLCKGTDFKFITKLEDGNVDIVKITENGIYKYTSYYDSEAGEFEPIEIEFLPLDLN